MWVEGWAAVHLCECVHCVCMHMYVHVKASLHVSVSPSLYFLDVFCRVNTVCTLFGVSALASV